MEVHFDEAREWYQVRRIVASVVGHALYRLRSAVEDRGFTVEDVRPYDAPAILLVEVGVRRDERLMFNKNEVLSLVIRNIPGFGCSEEDFASCR
jgi:hypothetical protein